MDRLRRHRGCQILEVCLQGRRCAKRLSFIGLVVSSGTTGKGLLEIPYSLERGP